MPDETRCARCGDHLRYHAPHFSSPGGRCEGFVDPADVHALATALEEAEREDLLAFALGQHRDKAEIVDLADWIHTAVAGKKNPRLRGIVGSPMPEYARPPMLTLLVPEEVVAMIHGEPKNRDCLLLVHIKREVLDSWLAQKEIAAGVQ